MTGPYAECEDDYKDFWIWLMYTLMPTVSSHWDSQKRGAIIEICDPTTGLPLPERMSNYLTASDFAYIPVVIEIYGRRELEDAGAKRSRGRTKGQPGMTQLENVLLYISSLEKMKILYERMANQLNVNDWGDAIFDYMDRKRSATILAVPMEVVTVGTLVAASNIAGQRAVGRVKKEQLWIPV
jgi:hypothetical protein